MARLNYSGPRGTPKKRKRKYKKGGKRTMEGDTQRRVGGIRGGKGREKKGRSGH